MKSFYFSISILYHFKVNDHLLLYKKTSKVRIYGSAMVTSTSTPGSIEIEVICLTISDGEWRSITRLWILIWKRSQVLEPSPQGVFLVVILKVLVGILTGPLTLRSFSLAPLIKSLQTFSKDFTVREVKVIRMR